MPLKKTDNHAIIIRIDWNENKWESPSSNLEFAKNFGFVKENNLSHTSFNFAHDKYQTEPDGLWYGLIPAFASKTPDFEKSKNLKIVFIISNYEKNDYIVGLYAFPKIGNSYRKNKIPGFLEYDWINIGASPNDILRIENYVKLETLDSKRAIGNQEISKMGWNYLTQSQVGYFFDSIQKENPEDSKLKKIKLKYLKNSNSI